MQDIPPRATEFSSKSGSIAKRHHRRPTTNSHPETAFNSWTKYSVLLLHHRPAGAANMSSNIKTTNPYFAVFTIQHLRAMSSNWL